MGYGVVASIAVSAIVLQVSLTEDNNHGRMSPFSHWSRFSPSPFLFASLFFLFLIVSFFLFF